MWVYAIIASWFWVLVPNLSIGFSDVSVFLLFRLVFPMFPRFVVRSGLDVWSHFPWVLMTQWWMWVKRSESRKESIRINKSCCSTGWSWKWEPPLTTTISKSTQLSFSPFATSVVEETCWSSISQFHYPNTPLPHYPTTHYLTTLLWYTFGWSSWWGIHVSSFDFDAKR